MASRKPNPDRAPGQPPAPSVSLIKLNNLARRYSMGAETIHALREVNLHIQAGEYEIGRAHV